MSTDLVTIMNTVAFMIGLAVMALTAYTAVLSRRREYGLLKALGAHGRHLYGAVVLQALMSLAMGLFFGLAFTALVAGLAPRLGTNLALIITARSVVRVGAVSLVIVGLAVLLPIRQMANLDPAAVFRRAS
jgi:putative ABC transport system permease protein